MNTVDVILVRSKAERTLRMIAPITVGGGSYGAFKNGTHPTNGRTDQRGWMIIWCVQKRNAPYEWSHQSLWVEVLMVRSKAERTLRMVAPINVGG